MDLGVQIDTDLYTLIDPSTEIFLYHDPGCAHGLWNGFMAAAPKHPFIRACLDQIRNNIANCFYGTRDLQITGPALVGEIFDAMYGFSQISDLFPAIIVENITKTPPLDFKYFTHKGQKVGTDKFDGQWDEFNKLGYCVTDANLYIPCQSPAGPLLF